MTIEFKIQLNDSGGAAAVVQPQANATILGPSLGSPQNQRGGSVPGDPPGGALPNQSSGSGAVVVVVPIVISGCCCQKTPAPAVQAPDV